jgi:hypothetical protein
MKKLLLCAMLFGCGEKDMAVLHPKGEGWECGYHAYQYQVVVSPESHDYDYMLHEGDHYYRVKKTCCPEGFTPAYKSGFYAGYCH